MIKYIDEHAFNATQSYSLSDNDFMVAVSVENWLEGEKNDPKYVQWVASHSIVSADGYEERRYPMNVCTDEDMSNFHPTE